MRNLEIDSLSIRFPLRGSCLAGEASGNLAFFCGRFFFFQCPRTSGGFLPFPTVRARPPKEVAAQSAIQVFFLALEQFIGNVDTALGDGFLADSAPAVSWSPAPFFFLLLDLYLYLLWGRGFF